MGSYFHLRLKLVEYNIALIKKLIFNSNRLVNAFVYFQKYLPILFCLLGVVVCLNDKQIKLEDIENDNLASERRTKQDYKGFTKPLYQQQNYQQTTQQYAPKMQYGFRPMKSPFPHNYKTQTQTQIQYVPQQQYKYLPEATKFGTQYTTLPIQYATQTETGQYTTQAQATQYIPPTKQFIPETPVQYKTQAQATKQYLPGAATQYTTQYVSYPQASQQYESQQYYQQYENLPYVVGNQLNQLYPTYQQYTPAPQYYYTQQQATNNIQSVVDPKTGQVQYFMYLPTPYYSPEVAADTNDIEQPQTYANVDTAQNYVVPSTQEVQYQYVNDQQPQKYTMVQYLPQTSVKETQGLQQIPQVHAQQLQQVPKVEPSAYVPKREPQSLLESYVPSILQYQYYKQQQAKINAIQQSLKTRQSLIGKAYVKPSSQGYLPIGQQSEVIYNNVKRGTKERTRN